MKQMMTSLKFGVLVGALLILGISVVPADALQRDICGKSGHSCHIQQADGTILHLDRL